MRTADVRGMAATEAVPGNSTVGPTPAVSTPDRSNRHVTTADRFPCPAAIPPVECVAVEPIASSPVECVAVEPIASSPVECVAVEPIASSPIENTVEDVIGGRRTDPDGIARRFDSVVGPAQRMDIQRRE